MRMYLGAAGAGDRSLVVVMLVCMCVGTAGIFNIKCPSSDLYYAKHCKKGYISN